MEIMIIFIFKREEGSLFDDKDDIRIRKCLNFARRYWSLSLSLY